MGLLGTIGGTVFRPGRTFKAVSSRPRPLGAGAKPVLAAGFLWALTAAGLAVSGALVTAPAFLRLAPENYYFYEMIFALPAFVLAWLLAGLAGGAASAGAPSGSLKAHLAALGPALSVPMLLAWIPQAALAVLLLLGRKQEEVMEWTAHPGIVQTAALACFIAAGAWMFFLAAAAARHVRGLGPLRSAAAGLTAAVVFVGVLAVAVR